MSTNLATILVGLGYDLSALEKGAPEAFQLINKQTLGMSAEMKRTSREGAESLRLIDEALGIHISRPLTRILTQEFPGLANALQSLLGVGVTGALAVVGVELFDKIARGIEKARKSQDEWKTSIQATDNAIQNVGDRYARQIAEAEGLTPLAKIAMQGADEAKKSFDEIFKAMEAEQKKAEEATGFWNELKATIGDAFHDVAVAFGGGTDTEKLQEQFKQLGIEIDQAFRLDAINGTHKALKVLEDDYAMATQKVAELEAAQIAAFAGAAGAVAGGHGGGPAFQPISPEQLEAARQAAKALKEALGIANDRETLDGTRQAKQAFEDERAAIQDADAAIQKFATHLVAMHSATLPAKDAITQLDDEFNKQIISTTRLNQLIGDDAFYAKYHAHLEQVIQDFLNVNVQKRASIDLDELLRKGLPGGTAGVAPAPRFESAAPAPTLGAGGKTAADFDVFQKDDLAQIKLAAQAYEDIITPQQKYDLGVKELSLLLDKGKIDHAAFTAAVTQLDQELVRSEDHLHKLETQLQKVLERSKDAGDGVKAFFLQLQIEASSDARFTFEILNKGLQGFEDETVKALTGAKTSWQQFFLSLDQMALKFMLNKGISKLLDAMSGTGLGKSLGLDKLFGGGQDQEKAADKQIMAGTTMLTAAGMQMAAANIMAASGAGGAGGGVGVGGILDAAIQGFASGTDYAPGGMAWVGENGPEVVNLPRGSSVTPTSELRGHTVHVHIDARGGEIGVEEKIARAISSSAPQIILRAVVEASEAQRRSTH